LYQQLTAVPRCPCVAAYVTLVATATMFRRQANRFTTWIAHFEFSIRLPMQMRPIAMSFGR